MDTLSRNQETNEKLNINVLLADDDEHVREMTTTILRSLGCTVEEVNNGKELVTRIDSSKEGEFSLVITDNDMPEMDGVQAIENIRSDARFKKIPVILFSGRFNNHLEKRINDLGGISLAKPFSVDALKAKIKEALLKYKDTHFTS